jgi:uncharacterized membrane protein
MDRILVVVFDTESKAYEATKALRQLDSEGSIAVYADAVVAKSADGTAMVKQSHVVGPLGTLAGTSLGSLIGLLGGPTGLAIGGFLGLVAGGAADLRHARVGGDFVEDVIKELRPNTFAVVAEINEDWTTSVDARMEAMGGRVFRRALSSVEDTFDNAVIAAMKADIAQLKAEHAQARADRKAKLHEKINQLDSKILARIEKAKERRQAAEQQAKAKAEILKAKASALEANAAATHV